MADAVAPAVSDEPEVIFNRLVFLILDRYSSTVLRFCVVCPLCVNVLFRLFATKMLRRLFYLIIILAKLGNIIQVKFVQNKSQTKNFKNSQEMFLIW